MELSPLQRERLRYTPTLPDCLAADTHLFKFRVEDNNIDKPWMKDDEGESKGARKQGERALTGAGSEAGVVSTYPTPAPVEPPYVGAALVEPHFIPADAARAAAPPPGRRSPHPTRTTTTTTTEAGTRHVPCLSDDSIGDRGGRLIDLTEYFPHTAATPVYHVVPGPALAGEGLAATERVKPIRMV